MSGCRCWPSKADYFLKMLDPLGFFVVFESVTKICGKSNASEVDKTSIPILLAFYRRAKGHQRYLYVSSNKCLCFRMNR